MGITTFRFFVFLFGTLGIYLLVPDKYKKHLLVLSSLLFYLSNGVLETCLVLIYIFLTYYFGILAKNKKRLVIFLILSLIPLFINKYSNAIRFLFCINLYLDRISILGISFFSFKAISYIVESYRKQNFRLSISDYLLYMIFFPVCLSGPIENIFDFLNETSNRKTLSWERFIESLLLIMYGLTIKLVFAERIIGIINAIYSNYEIYTRYNILAILAYPFYIYSDFAGYSCIAEGAGKLFGYDLVDNFKQPYFSISVQEFWNRWHISLNNWLRTYIYIPLGGNRKGKIRKNLNILIVFLVSGIWHGAGLGFIIWGLLNGLYQVVGDITSGFRRSIASKVGFDHFVFAREMKMTVVFLLISLSWVFFSQGIDGIKVIASIIYSRKVSLMDFALAVCAEANSSKVDLIVLTVTFFLMLFVDTLEYKKKGAISTTIARSSFLRVIVLLLLFFTILVFGKYGSGYDASNFVYFDF